MHYRRQFLILLVLFAVAIVGLVAACGDEETTPAPVSAIDTPPAGAEAPPPAPTQPKTTLNLPDKIVAPHFINSYPAHGDILAQVPNVAVLNFNFNLNDGSFISATRNGEKVPLGPVTISADQLTMRVPFEESGTDGVYQLTYQACWPDRTCHDGSVSFVVDGDTLGQYQDLRGQAEVTVHMKDGLRFDPAHIIISPGTTVTWVNGDSIIHFVNTDPHPSHNLLDEQNSTGLNPGDTYTYSFTEAGAWGYHCSAHQNRGMTAQVIVK